MQFDRSRLREDQKSEPRKKSKRECEQKLVLEFEREGGEEERAGMLDFDFGDVRK